MATWPSKPEWKDPSSINAGSQYLPADGVTVNDMNTIIEDLLYLRKYGGRVNTLVTNAAVDGTILKLNAGG